MAETMDIIIRTSFRDSVLGGKSGKDTPNVEIGVGNKFPNKAFCFISNKWQYIKMMEEKEDWVFTYSAHSYITASNHEKQTCKLG